MTLFWKLVGRGKRSVVLDLHGARSTLICVASSRTADVLVENIRPGKLEALGLDPDELIDDNPRLVITRVTGFGQDGPYAGRPGFATLAEAMSGFAAVNGEPDGQPLLPPIALTDEVTAIVAAFATMVAVHSGVGQVVDVNLLESMLQLMGALPSAWATLGYEQPRLGSGIPYTRAPGHLPLRRRPLGGHLDLGRVRGPPGDGRWSAPATTRVSRASRVGSSIVARSTTCVAAWIGGSLDGRGAWPRSRRPRPPPRRCTAMAEVADDPHVLGPPVAHRGRRRARCRAWWPACRPRPAGSGSPLGTSAPTPPRCWPSSTTTDRT